MPAQGKKYLSISETAKFLGVSIDTIRRWDKNGTLASVRLDGKNRYFDTDQLKSLKSNKPLSISEAAVTLGISITTLRRLEARGLIIPSRDANGERLYTKESLDQYITSRDLKRKEAANRAPVASVMSGIVTEVSSPKVFPVQASTEVKPSLMNSDLSQTPSQVQNAEISPRETTNNIVESEAKSEKSENSASQKVTKSELSEYSEFSDTPSSLTSRHSDSPISSFFKPQTFAFMAPRLTRPNFAPAFSRNPMFKMAAGATAALFLISILSYSVVISSRKETTVKTIIPKMEIAGAQVLASTSRTLDGNMKFNISTLFNAPARFSETIEVNGTALFTEDVTVQDKNLTLGTGAFTAGTSTITGLSTTGSLAVNGASNLNGTLDVVGVATFGDVINFGNLSTDPATGVNGAQYYNTTSNIFRCYANNAWVNCDTDTTSGGTMSSFNIETNGSNSFSVGNGNTVDFIAGSNVTISTNTSDKSITISAAGSSGGMTSFTLAGDSGTNQTISDASTLTVAGGDGINTVTSATGVVTADIDLFTGATGTATTSSASGLEISGGALSLIRGCNDTQILSWNDGTGEWACTNGGGSSAIINVEEEGVPVGTNVTTLNYAGADFDLTTPVSSSTVYLQVSSAIPRKANNETISGSWTYSSATPITLSNTAPVIAIGATGTLSFTDGSNTLLSIADNGTSGQITTGNATLTALSSGSGTQLCINVSNQIVTCNSGSGGVTGSGTPNQIPKFTTTTNIGDSLLADDGTTLTYAGTGGMSLSGSGAPLTVTDNAWLGLGSGAGRIEFDDQTTDEVNILNANVGIGTSTPIAKLQTAASGNTLEGIFGSASPVVLQSNWGTVAFNSYNDGSGQKGYTGGGAYAGAIQLRANTGQLSFNMGGAVATAGDAVTMATVMMLSQNGNLMVGPTFTDTYRLEVTGAAGTTRAASITGAGAKTAADYGAYVSNTSTSSTNSINKYGTYITSTGTWNGTSANNYGLYVDTVSGGTNNYGAVFASGNVGVGDTSPTALFTVGSGDVFQVNSSGAIAAATGITSSGTITFSGFSANGGVLYTNGSGILAQTAAGTGTQCLLGGTTPSFGDCSSGGGISGSGTTNTIPKFTSASAIGDSLLTDNGTTFAINSTMFTVTEANGNTAIAGTLDVTGHGAFGNNASVVSGQVLTVDENSSITSGTIYGTLSAINANAAGASTANYAGVRGGTNIITAQQYGSVYGVQGAAYALLASGASVTGSMVGVGSDVGGVSGITSGTIANLIGFENATQNAEDLTVTNSYGLYAKLGSVDTGAITNNYGIRVVDGTQGAGTIGTNYGLYVNAITTGDTANYGIYVADAGTASLYLASTDGDVASGITFGGDTVLYRSAADTLRTNDAFNVNGTLNISSAGAITGATGYSQLAGAFTLTPDGTNDINLTVANGSGRFLNIAGLASGTEANAVCQDASGNLITCTYGGGITGSGSTNTISKFTSASSIGDSLLTDDGTTLTYSGTGGLTLSGAGADLVFANGESINNDVNGTIGIVGALSTSGAISAPTSTDTINGLIINAGALSAITGYSQSSGAFAATLTTTNAATFVSSTANSDSIALKPATGGANAFTGTITTADLTVGNQTFTLPNLGAATTDTVCLLTLANCVGTGGGISGSGTTNTISKFTSASAIGNSLLTDDGTTLTYTGAGGATLGVASTTTGLLNLYNSGNAFYTRFQTSASQGADVTYTLPIDDGTDNYVLTTDGSGVLAWESVSGAGGVSGSGTSGQIAFFNGASSITSESSGFGWDTANKLFTLTSTTTTGTAQTITANSLTTGEAFEITSALSPTDGSTNEFIDLNFTNSPSSSANTTEGINLSLTDATALNNTLYGTRISVDNSSNTSTGSHSIYGGHFTATGKTAGTTTAYGIYATASGADTNWAGYFAGRTAVEGTNATGATLSVTNNSLTTGSLISASTTSTAITSGDLANFQIFSVLSSGATLNYTGNVLDVDRQPTITNSSTLNMSGALASFTSNCFTGSGGACNDSGTVVSVSQSYASATGAVLNLSNAGSGYAINITGAGTRTINSTSGDLALATTTSGNITMTPSGATALVNVLTGNLKVGNGTPTQTLSGESAYIEGLLEIDGAIYNDGLTSGTPTGSVCYDSSNKLIQCSGGSSLTGSGTSGQIAFFNGASSITSETSGFGWDTTNKLLTVSSTATTQTANSFTGTSFTTGELLDLTGTWAPTDGSTNEAIDINITHTPTSSADNFQAINLTTSDGTALANTIYNLQGTLTLTGNAAKVGYGLNSSITSNSTTADTTYAGYFGSTITGVITTGTREQYGIYSAPTLTAANSGGTSNVYGAYFAPNSTTSTTGSTVNVYGAYVNNTGTLTSGGTINSYGLFVGSGTTSTTGSSTKYGLYVASQSGADTSYGIFAVNGNTSNDIGIQTNLSSASTALYLNTSPGNTSGYALRVAGSELVSSDFTSDYVLINPSRSVTSASTVTDSGNYLDVTRSNSSNNASAVLNTTGDLVRFSSNMTQTSGTATDSSNILELTQSYASATGAVFNISNAGTGVAIEIGGAGSRTINSTSGNLALATTTSGNITMTPSSATALVNVLTGNLKVGNGTPTQTQDGEDAYVEGLLEVDGVIYNDGLTSGTPTGSVCYNSSNAFIQCSGGSSLTGSGTSGQIAFFNGASSITSETSGFGWDTANKLFTLTSTTATGVAQTITADSLTSGSALAISTTPGAARSGDLVSITQASGTDSTGNLLQLTNSDTGSTNAALDIAQVANGTGINISGITGSGIVINVASNIGSGVQGLSYAGSISGQAIQFNSSISGAATYYASTVSGYGQYFAGVVSGEGIRFNASVTGYGMRFAGGLSGYGIRADESTGIAALTSTSFITGGGSASGTIGGLSANIINIAPTRTDTGAGTITDSGSYLNIARSLTVNNGSATFNNTGDLVKLSSNMTQTSGTISDNSNILELTQSYASATGAVINLSNAGTGVAIEIGGAGSRTINSTSGDLALATATSGNITMTPSSATALVNVLTGNLKIGNGTPGQTLNGEDLYVEGLVEIDGVIYNDGLTSGTPTGSVCYDSSNAFIQCSGGSSLTGSGTSGQIAFFNGTSSITSETSGFGWDTANKLFTLTSTATTQSAAAFVANSLTTGNVLSLTSTSTAGGGSGSSYLLNLARSGTNSNATHTAYGIASAVTNTGTTSTNIAGYFSASGASNNYGIIVPNGGGNVGIGTSAPGALLELDAMTGTGSSAGMIIDADTADNAYIDFYEEGVFQSNIFWNGSANYLHINSGTDETIISDANLSLVGIGTTAPDRKLEINSLTGVNLRLTYADGNGSATNYSDFLMSSSGDLTIDSSGSDTNIAAGDNFNLVSGAGTFNQTFTGTTTTAHNLTANSLTTGEAMDITAALSPTDGSTNEFIDLNFTNSPSSSAAITAGIDLAIADATSLGNLVSGYTSTITLTNNAAKAGTGYYGLVTSNSTTADNLFGYSAGTTATGIITTGTRGAYGYYSTPTAGAESTGGTTNVYGFYSQASGDVGAGGTLNAYGLYVANGTYDTDGTSAAYGVYVAALSGADNNYSLYLADATGGTNTGITFGADTNLYRSAADTLRTDDAFIAGTTLSAYGTTIGLNNDADANNVFSFNTGAAGVASGDLYWGDDLLCDVSAANCGTGATTWNTIGDPTGNQALTFDDTEISTWTINSDTEAVWTMNANSLTTGEILNLAHTTSVIANGGSLMRLSSTSADTGTTTGNLLDLSSSGSTAGSLMNIATSNASQTTTTALAITQSGVTTGYTGNLVNITGSSTTGSGTLLNLTSVATSAGTGLKITANSLTDGTAMSIGSTSTGLAAGSLLSISTGSTSSLSGAAVRITATADFAGHTNGGLFGIFADSTTAGIVSNISVDAMTTGRALNITSTSTGLTSGSLIFAESATTGAVASNGIIHLAAYGNYTSSSNVGLLQVEANATTGGTIQNIQGNALTTGTALRVASTGTGLTSGNLLAVTSGTTGAVSSGIVSLTASGAYTSSSNAGLLNLYADSTTAGTIANISGNALTTGNGLRVASTSTGITSGTLLYVGSATTAQIASNGLVNIESTGAYTSNSFAGLINVESDFTQSGSVLNISANSLTTGSAFRINSSGTGLTTGSLMSVNSATTGTLNSNGIVALTASGNYASSGNDNSLLRVTANSTTAGTIQSIHGTALTTGVGLYLTNSTSAMTTGSLIRVEAGGTGTVATNGIIQFRQGGNYASTSNVGFHSVTANSTTAGTVMDVRGNALTTGQALYVASSSTGLTSGSLIYGTTASTGAIATNGAYSFNATGNYTSTSNMGMFNINASATTAGTVHSLFADALTTGVGLYTSVDGITTGTGWSLNSTSTAFTSGKLQAIDWSPGSSTTASGDLLSINMGANALGANLLNLYNNGSSVFSVNQTQFTTSLPANFTAAGDVSLAYDMNFTNATASYITSDAPLYLVAGETFNSSNLVLQTYNNGAVVVDSALSLDSQITLTANSTTPSVAGGSHFITANSSGTLITNFTNGTDGQIIYIQINDANTDLDCTSSSINCGTTDVTNLSSGDVIGLLYNGSKWNLLSWMRNTADNSNPTNGVDLAEYFFSNEALVPGDVVSIDQAGTAYVRRSNVQYDNKAMGVIATQPGIILGPQAENTFPVALVGRVPVKVDPNSAPIREGDFLTASGTSGMAMKAQNPGQMLGRALEDWTPGNGQTTVLMFVNASYADPNRALANLRFDENGNLIVPNQETDLPAQFAEEGWGTGSGSLSLDEFDSDIVTGGSGTFANLFANVFNASSQTVTNALEAGEVVSNTIFNKSKDVSVELTDGLNVKSNNQTVFSVNEQGEASASAKISAPQISASQATIETLTVKNLIVENLMQNGATGSATIDFAEQGLKADVGEFDLMTINTDLTVAGTATLADVAVLNQMKFNNNLTINETSINTLGTDLEIQPLQQAAVSIMADAVRIETDGTVTFNENVAFKKDVEVAGVLSATTIEGTLDDIKISSASAATEISDTVVEASGAAGLVTLKAGELSVKVNNPKVTEDSLIFITPKGTTYGKTLYIKSQIDGASFTVGMEGTTPAASDIKFNFLIVN